VGLEDSKKTMLVYVIENVLLKIGRSSYELVLTRLQKDYGCHISGCVERPEYLKRALEDIYGDASGEILEQIKTELGDLAEQKYYRNFVEVINAH
jgi:hypothetical protein